MLFATRIYNFRTVSAIMAFIRITKMSSNRTVYILDCTKFDLVRACWKNRYTAIEIFLGRELNFIKKPEMSD